LFIVVSLTDLADIIKSKIGHLGHWGCEIPHKAPS
jgi:hypothetical protein